MKKIIIIGATASGMTVSSFLNRYGKEKIELVVYEKRSYVSFGACGIPFLISGVESNFQELLSPSLEQHLKKGINIKVNHEVIKVDFNDKKIMIKNLENNQIFEDIYDELFIATGAKPFIPLIKFSKKIKNIRTSTSLEDAIFLAKKAKDPQIKEVLIIGGGYIGLELAESFSLQNKKVTIIEKTNQIMNGKIDLQMAQNFMNLMSKHVEIKVDEYVQEIDEENNYLKIKTNKNIYQKDLIILATGFIPNTDLFDNTNLKKNLQKAIIINEKGQTSVKNVWSAGDCATVFNRITQKNDYIPLATTARKISKIIALNILNKDTKFLGTIGTSGLRFHNDSIFKCGLSQKNAKKHQIETIEVLIDGTDSANYAGQQEKIQLKLLAKKNGILIGAQIIGKNNSAAIRMAVLSTAIWNKMNVKEIIQIDFFYTPPFSKAVDIIHVAANQLSKKII